MPDKLGTWEKKEGVEFIERLGVGTGEKVLDFGAGYGHYTLPAAEVVGKRGVIYAVDKREEPLSAIADKASDRGLSNIKTVKNTNSVSLKFEPDLIDAVFLFDILHYMEEDKRRKLYREVSRVLNCRGELLVYPKHTQNDFPMGEFKDLKKEDVVDEIQEENLIFDEKVCGKIAHDDDLSQGCIFKFVKPKD